MANETHSFDVSEPSSGKVPTLDKGTLHRVIGVRELFAIGYSDVGSSIYYALGITTLYALGAAPLALAIAGLVFFCTALTYAEMSSALPEAGGSASFARHGFNDLVSFIAGWALLLDYIVTIAISAYTVGPYLSYFYPILKTPYGNVPFTLLILGILLALNVFGIKESTRVSLLLCAFDILTQLAIISIGAFFLFNLPHLVRQMRVGIPNVDWSPTWPQFFKGISMAMVAYIGIESISQLGGEARDAEKKVPRAIIITMLTLFVVYFGISSVALSAIHPRELSTTYLEDPLAGIAAALPVGRNYFGPWIGILGATILFVAANAGLVGASRLTFAMGEHFQLPRVLYTLHPKFKTPYISLILFSVLAGLVVFVAKKLVFIADLYNFGAMLAFFLAHLSLIALRIRQPDLRRPFKLRGNLPIGKIGIPITAFIGLLGTFLVWVDVVISKPAGRNLGFVWMFLGVGFYFLYRKKHEISATSRIELEKIEMPEYKEQSITKVLVPTRGENFNTIQYAAKVAHAHGASLTALYVIEIPASLPLDTFFPDRLLKGDTIMESCQAICREYSVAAKTLVLQSRSAGEAIYETARDGGYDLIVLGTSLESPSKIRTRLGSALGSAVSTSSFLGSTVDYVLKHAPCRVWICAENPSLGKKE